MKRVASAVGRFLWAQAQAIAPAMVNAWLKRKGLESLSQLSTARSASPAAGEGRGVRMADNSDEPLFSYLTSSTR
jgi:hypothetical protein